MTEIYKGAAPNDKTGTPARTAAQIINDNFAYLDNKITRKDGIVVSTGFVVVDQDITLNPFWEWIIDTIDYTNPSEVTMNFPLASAGKSRLDLIALTTSNAPVRIAGTESDSAPVSPPLPDNMLQASLVLVTDSLVGEPTPPVIGDTSGKENISNKVSTIAGNEADTTKYPNTKAVNDADVIVLEAAKNYADSVSVKVWNVKDYGALGNGMTDDALAIQNTINACNSAGGGTVYFPNGIYYISGALDSNSQSQIYFPLNSFSSSIALKTIKLLGETPPNQYSNPFNSTGSNDHPDTGVILKSNLLSVGNVIGSRSEAITWGNFNFIHAKIENISVRVRSITGVSNVAAISTGINMGNVSMFTGANIEVCTTSQMAFSIEPASSCLGIVMPKNNNFAFASIKNTVIIGVYKAIDCYEHTHIDNVMIDICVIGLNMNAVNHSIQVTKTTIQRSRYNIQVQNSSYFYIDHVSFEDDYSKSIPTPTWNRTLYDLNDVDGTSSGLIRFHTVRSNYGVDYTVTSRNSVNSKIKFIKINELTEYNAIALSPPPISAVMAYWKFDEAIGSYADSSGNGRTSARINGATSGVGKIGNAILTASSSEQGANSGSTGLSYNGTSIAFSGWVKINTNTNAYQVILQKGDSSEREYSIYYEKSSATISFQVFNGTTVRGVVVKSGIIQNVWFYLYVEMVGSSLKISVNNGSFSTSSTSGAVSVNTAKDLTIGYNYTVGSALNGAMDELAILNRALTAGEIAYLYNNGFGNSIV